jgi:long-chain acyl-CoA synthetase
LKIKEDLAELKPTVFPSVPRLWSRMFDVISAQFKEQTGLKAKLIARALATKLENLRKTASVTHPIYDALVFKKTKAVLGGRVRLMVTGSAPIASNVIDFLKVCFCSPILEGYG